MHSGGGGCSRSGHSDAHRCARGVGGASASCPQLRLEWMPIRSGTSRRLAWTPAHLVRASPRLARTSPPWLWKEEISKQKQPCRARWPKREERPVSWRPPFWWVGAEVCAAGTPPARSCQRASPPHGSVRLASFSRRRMRAVHRRADSAGACGLQGPWPVPLEVAVALLDDVANVDADAKDDAAIVGYTGITFDRRVLHVDRTAHCVDRTAELDNAAVADPLYN